MDRAGHEHVEDDLEVKAAEQSFTHTDYSDREGNYVYGAPVYATTYTPNRRSYGYTVVHKNQTAVNRITGEQHGVRVEEPESATKRPAIYSQPGRPQQRPKHSPSPGTSHERDVDRESGSIVVAGNIDTPIVWRDKPPMGPQKVVMIPLQSYASSQSYLVPVPHGSGNQAPSQGRIVQYAAQSSQVAMGPNNAVPPDAMVGERSERTGHLVPYEGDSAPSQPSAEQGTYTPSRNEQTEFARPPVGERPSVPHHDIQDHGAGHGGTQSTPVSQPMGPAVAYQRSETATRASSPGRPAPTHPQDAVYPPAEATHEQVFRDPQLFNDTLQRLHENMGSKFRLPVVMGQELDAHLLYCQVTTLGGVELVINMKKWNEVCIPFKFPPSFTSKAFTMRKIYVNLLYHYEQVYFYRNTGPVLPLPRNEPQGSHGPKRHKGESRALIMDHEAEPGFFSAVTPTALALPPPTHHPATPLTHPPLVAFHQPSKATVVPSDLVGVAISGVVDARFDHGYFATIHVGGQEFQGVLYMPGVKNATPAGTPAPAPVTVRQYTGPQASPATVYVPHGVQGVQHVVYSKPPAGNGAALAYVKSESTAGWTGGHGSGSAAPAAPPQYAVQRTPLARPPAYQGSQPGSGGPFRPRGQRPVSRPKPHKSAFRLFSMAMRNRARAMYPDRDAKDINRVLSEMWQATPSLERRPYVEQSQRDKTRFDREWQEFASSWPAGTVETPAQDPSTTQAGMGAHGAMVVHDPSMGVPSMGSDEDDGEMEEGMEMEEQGPLPANNAADYGAGGGNRHPEGAAEGSEQNQAQRMAPPMAGSGTGGVVRPRGSPVHQSGGMPSPGGGSGKAHPGQANNSTPRGAMRVPVSLQQGGPGSGNEARFQVSYASPSHTSDGGGGGGSMGTPMPPMSSLPMGGVEGHMGHMMHHGMHL